MNSRAVRSGEFCIRRRRQDSLPRLALDGARHSIHGLFQAGILIAPAGSRFAARLEPAGPPKLENVAIVALQPRLLGIEPSHILLGCYFFDSLHPHGGILRSRAERVSEIILATRARPSYANAIRKFSPRSTNPKKLALDLVRDRRLRTVVLTTKGSGTPTDAMFHEAVLASTAAHPAGCARLSAFRRGSRQSCQTLT